MLDEGITKLYYTIGEVAAQVDEEPHVLRYWETEFGVLRPRKNRAGKRVYTQSDIDTVFRIRHLLREEKYTIDGARRALKRERSSGGSDSDEVEQLTEVRDFLSRLMDRIKTE
ncbi:MAG: MerR family transcriptional regulator [Rhodothermales bacterium]|nr:MerR family transcriptional regulator [Rhodothermales bacterium]